MHCSRRRSLWMGLEFHVCTINKSAHTKNVWKVIECTSYLIYVWKQDLALNNKQGLIYHKMQPTNQPPTFALLTRLYVMVLSDEHLLMKWNTRRLVETNVKLLLFSVTVYTHLDYLTYENTYIHKIVFLSNFIIWKKDLYITNQLK